MSEQTFRSPGFFEQEIELTAPGAQPTGIPGGLIGAAASGPAFVPGAAMLQESWRRGPAADMGQNDVWTGSRA